MSDEKAIHEAKWILGRSAAPDAAFEDQRRGAAMALLDEIVGLGQGKPLGWVLRRDPDRPRVKAILEHRESECAFIVGYEHGRMSFEWTLSAPPLRQRRLPAILAGEPLNMDIALEYNPVDNVFERVEADGERTPGIVVIAKALAEAVSLRTKEY